MAAERIPVEHEIGELKKFLGLSDRPRNYPLDLYDEMIGVYAETWHFYLTN